MKLTCTTCPTCNKEIRNNNFKRHVDTCTGLKIKKIRGVDFDPNAGFKDGSRTIWNKGKSKETDTRVAKYGESIRITKEGQSPCGCCAWSTEERSIAAKRLGFGGYRENAGHSKKFKVMDSFGKETTLQSSYELECSQILDKLGIKWNRPKAMKYGGRNYFADFYLPEYEVYLDPKNNYKAKLDAVKIAAVIEENKVRLFVLLKEQITEEYIGMLIQR